MIDCGVVSGTLSASVVGAVVSTTLKISTVAYELKAVGENARDLLDSTKHVSNNLQTARTLRRQKSVHFDNNEKKWIDGVLASTEKTLSNVAAMIEPARVDMQTKFGNVGILNRGLFVFRDSPKVQTNLARLSIASGSLDTVLNVLCAREGRLTFLSPKIESSALPDASRMRRKSHSSLRSEASSPPSYQSSERPSQTSEAPPTNRRQRLLGREVRECIITESPIEITGEPLCSATCNTPPPSIYAIGELDGLPLAISRTPSFEKEPVIQIQQVAELESPPLHTQESTCFNNFSGNSTAAFHSPPILQTRKSTSSFRSSTSTLVSVNGGGRVTSNMSTKSSGVQRGRAWMAHQAGK